MKKYLLPLFFFIAALASAQTVDTSAIIREIDSLKTLASSMKPKEALPVYLQMHELALQHLGNRHTYYLEALRNTTGCYKLLGQFDSAEQYATERCERLAEVSGKQSIAYGKAVLDLGVVYLLWKKFEPAERLFTACLNIFQAQTLEYVDALDQMSILHLYTGRFESAERLLLEVLAIKEKILGKEDRSYLMTLANLGNAYSRAGVFEKAEKVLLETRDIKGKISGTKTLDYAGAQQNLAVVYANMGKFEEAESLYKDALDIKKAQLGTENPTYSISVYNLGHLYLRMGRYKAAESWLLEAKAIREKIYGTDNTAYANASLALGNLYNAMRQYDKPEPLLLDAIRIYEKESPEKRSYNYPDALAALGNLYQNLGKMEAAESLLLQATDIGKKILGPDHPEYFGYVWSLAKFYARIGNKGKAIAYFGDGLGILDRTFRKGERYFSENELLTQHTLTFTRLDQFYGFVQNNPLEAAAVGLAYDFTLNYKNSLFENRIQWQKAIRAADKTAQDEYARWLALLRRIAEESVKPAAERIPDAHLEEDANKLEKELIRQVGALPGTENRPKWQDIRDKLKKGEACIEFVSYHRPVNWDSLQANASCSAMIIRPGDEFPHFVPLFDDKSVGNLRAIRSLYAAQKQEGEPNLRDLLWQPLAPYLEGVKTIYYAPAGLLHRINFGAIPVSATETLGERFQLHNLGGTRQLAFPRLEPSFEAPDALVFGGIEYDSADYAAVLSKPVATVPGETRLGDTFRAFRDNDWPYLEWTKKEAEEVKNILTDSGAKAAVFSGRKANEETFKQIGTKGPSPRILHIATHGFFFPDADSSATSGFQSSKNPLLRSGLVLAGANAAWKGKTAAGKEDGILTAYEIAQMDLSNTELIVLSACETGLGELKRDEGVFGLQRAFKMAGAKYVLMSLWSVSDRQTYEFMTMFYREWLEKGKDIPAAYQSTQNQMRKKYNMPPNPTLWAGFILAE